MEATRAFYGEKLGLRLALGIVLATVASYPLGMILGGGLLLPALNTAAAYAAMVWLLRRGRRREAVLLMLLPLGILWGLVRLLPPWGHGREPGEALARH